MSFYRNWEEKLKKKSIDDMGANELYEVVRELLEERIELEKTIKTYRRDTTILKQHVENLIVEIHDLKTQRDFF